MTVWNGDPINGHKVETTFSRHRMGEAAQRLIEAVAPLSPWRCLLRRAR
jgi:hypothetical protein